MGDILSDTQKALLASTAKAIRLEERIEQLEENLDDLLDEIDGADCMGSIAKILRQHGR